MVTKHTCYRCEPVSFTEGALGRERESIAGTRSEEDDDVFFVSGYSAREIAQKRARETSGRVYVNNVSRKIKRADLSVPVAYAVARSPVYTLMGPDEWHPAVYRVYWRPLS